MPPFPRLTAVFSAPVPATFPLKLQDHCPAPSGLVLKKLSIDQFYWYGNDSQRWEFQPPSSFRYFQQKLVLKEPMFPENHWGYLGRLSIDGVRPEAHVRVQLHYDPASDLLDGTLVLSEATGCMPQAGELLIGLCARYGELEPSVK